MRDDSEGLAELVRSRWGIDISADEEPAPETAAPGGDPELTGEPPDDDQAGPRDEPRVDVQPEPVTEFEFARDTPDATEPIDGAGYAARTESETTFRPEPEPFVVEGAVVVLHEPPGGGGPSLDPEFEVVEGADPRLVREHALDLRLARLHLRTGSVQLARAELEALAVLKALDVDAHLDLAESRWRAGDLVGAGDAVVEYLEGGGDEGLAYVIAAEASAAMGRVGDARRLARRALDRLTLPLERVFAGQPRSEVWPGPTDAEVQPVSTLFASPGPEPMRGGRIGLSGAPAASSGHVRPLDPLLASGQMDPWESPPTSTGSASEATPYEALSLGLDLERVENPRPAPVPFGAGPAARSRGSEAFDPVAELDGARRSIEAGDLERAGVRLALVLRARPALAPAVLDLARDVRGPVFDLVRGDALRMTGNEAAAQDAFAAAIRAVDEQDGGLRHRGAAPAPGLQLPRGTMDAALLEFIAEPEPQPTEHLAWDPNAPEPEPPAEIARSWPPAVEPEPDAASMPEFRAEPRLDDIVVGWPSARRYRRPDTGPRFDTEREEESSFRRRPGLPLRRPPTGRPAHFRPPEPPPGD